MTNRVRPWRPHLGLTRSPTEQLIRGLWIEDHDEWSRAYASLARQRDNYRSAAISFAMAFGVSFVCLAFALAGVP